MKSLETIQKTFSIFKTLVKVAKILCIVGAAIFAVAAFCALTENYGGTIFSLFGQPLELFENETVLIQKFVEMLAAAFMLTAGAILFSLCGSYLKSELADGTPFTESGSKRLKKLGIQFIYIPAVAIAASEAVAIGQGVNSIGRAENYSGVAIGIMLILVSLIFKYGAELESRNIKIDNSTKAVQESNDSSKGSEPIHKDESQSNADNVINAEQKTENSGKEK